MDSDAVAALQRQHIALLTARIDAQQQQIDALLAQMDELFVERRMSAAGQATEPEAAGLRTSQAEACSPQSETDRPQSQLTRIRDRMQGILVGNMREGTAESTKSVHIYAVALACDASVHGVRATVVAIASLCLIAMQIVVLTWVAVEVCAGRAILGPRTLLLHHTLAP